MPTAPDNLERFVDAQHSIHEQVCEELRNGVKTGHGMWFIFPQLRGLGHSTTAHKYGIASRQEAGAYLKHPVLGPRLEECTRLVNQIESRSIHQIFGSIDAMKFRSSMTLFANASHNRIFKDALEKYFNGEPDPLTIERLKA
jgi:uncharacterized protein (DUF1810 family)